MWQNTGWMLGLGWRNYKPILGFGAASAALGVATNLVGIFIAPVILGTIASGVAAGELIAVILAFTGALMALRALTNYVNANSFTGEFHIRLVITAINMEKNTTTSYPNMMIQDYQKKQEKAREATNGHDEVAHTFWHSVMLQRTGFSISLKNALVN